MNILRSNKARIFFTVFLVYLFYISPAYINAGTMRYADLTKAIVDDRTFNIDKYHTNTIDYSFYGGHYYIGAAPGLSLMAVPVYAALKPFFRLIPQDIYKSFEFSILNLFFALFLAVLPGALISVLLYDILDKFNLKEKEKLLIVFSSSFGTLLFFYSTKFMAHTFPAFTLFSAFYVMLKSKDRPVNIYLAFLAGLLMGLSVLTEYIMIVGAIPLFIYAFISFKMGKPKNYFAMIAGSALTAFLYFYYHNACFGSPFGVAFGHGGQYGQGAWISLHMPTFRIIYELTFGGYRGTFTYMPVLLFSIYGMYLFFKRPEKSFLYEMLFIALFSFLIFFVTAIYGDWTAGGAFGQRYFVYFLPFFAIPMAFVFKKVKFKIIFWIAAASIFINWCGVQYGDADNFLTNAGLFLFNGVNSNFAQWSYEIVNTYVHKFNVITHFSPLIGLLILTGVLYVIWKDEINVMLQGYFCKQGRTA